MKYQSVMIKLNDVIMDGEVEGKIINKLLECKNLSGKMFKVFFWHKDLTEKDCKEFVMRNEDILFELNTEITKLNKDTWLIVDSISENESKWRYKWDGGIISGLDEYIRLVNHTKKRHRR